MNIISNNENLTKEINNIYPSKNYIDYTQNLNFPIKLGLPEIIVNDISNIKFNDPLQYGGTYNLFNNLKELFKKKVLKRYHMKNIIYYYQKQNKKK